MLCRSCNFPLDISFLFLTKICDTLFILLLSSLSRGRSSICRIDNVLNALFPSFLPEYIFPVTSLPALSTQYYRDGSFPQPPASYLYYPQLFVV